MYNKVAAFCLENAILDTLGQFGVTQKLSESPKLTHSFKMSFVKVCKRRILVTVYYTLYSTIFVGKLKEIVNPSTKTSLLEVNLENRLDTILFGLRVDISHRIINNGIENYGSYIGFISK